MEAYATAPQSRSLDSVSAAMSELVTVVDPSGTSIDIATLSAEQQAAIRQAWLDMQQKQIAQKIQADSRLAAYVDAFNETMGDENGARSIDRDLPAKLAALKTRYAERLAELPATPAPRGIDINTLFANYQWGRVLVHPNKDVIGHAAIMAGDQSAYIQYNSETRATVSSWGMDFQVKKNGGSWAAWDGVQKEPAWIWTEYYADHNLYQVHYNLLVTPSVWSWTWYWETRPTSATENISAKDYARAQEKKPYNYFLPSKLSTDAFYCSSLVWRSWYQVHTNLDLCPLPWIAPADIALDDNVTKIY
jgi:hypothetical protein